MGLMVLCVLSPPPSTLQDTVEHVIGMITPNTPPPPPHSPPNCPFDPDLSHFLMANPLLFIPSLPFLFLSSFHISWIRFEPPATSPDRLWCKQSLRLMERAKECHLSGLESQRGEGEQENTQRVSVRGVQTELWRYSHLINREWKRREAV